MNEQDERIQDFGRIGRVESTVLTLAHDLRQHIVDEGKVFDEFRTSIERLAVTAEMHTKLMDRMSDTLSNLALLNTRMVVNEEFRERTEGALKDLQVKTEENKDASNAIILERSLVVKGFTVLGTLLAAAWAVITFIFK